RMRTLKRFGKVINGHNAKSIGAVARAGAMAEATYGDEDMGRRMRTLKRFGKVINGHNAKSIGAVARAGAMAEATYGDE
ncbi:unnamed protein product, partial [Prorocentrum cordatum]